jgi:hypothetical protein
MIHVVDGNIKNVHPSNHYCQPQLAPRLTIVFSGWTFLLIPLATWTISLQCANNVVACSRHAPLNYFITGTFDSLALQIKCTNDAIDINFDAVWNCMPTTNWAIDANKISSWFCTCVNKWLWVPFYTITSILILNTCCNMTSIFMIIIIRNTSNTQS